MQKTKTQKCTQRFVSFKKKKIRDNYDDWLEMAKRAERTFKLTSSKTKVTSGNVNEKIACHRRLPSSFLLILLLLSFLSACTK